MTAPIRVTPEYELFRIITDYEALQDGFLDRIDDLETTMRQIELSGEFAHGELQKLLSKNAGKRIERKRDHRYESARRTFGWKSLGETLKHTGLALVLVVDDARFAEHKAELAKRKRARSREVLPAGSIKLLKGKITPKISKKLQVLRNAKLSPQQRRRIAKWAATMRWKAERARRCVAKNTEVAIICHGQSAEAQQSQMVLDQAKA
jgi:hypothetical protein